MGVVSLARLVYPAMSANRIEASSYLSAMMLRVGSLRRLAIDAGRMFASSDSDRWYSDSIAFSARSISRIAYQTVATTITAEPMTELMKPTVSIHGGPRFLSLGTRSSRAIDPAAPNATIVDARTMRSIPNTRSTSVAATRK